MMRARYGIAVAASIALSVAVPNRLAAQAEGPLFAGPIFDVHLHYNAEIWDRYDPAAARKVLKDAGVRRAIVSSWPDEGSLKLHAADPKMFQPMLRPYRDRVTRADWFHHDSVPAFMAERLAEGAPRGVYKGVGEFHLFAPEDARSAVARRAVELAVARDLFVYIHSDAATLEVVLDDAPRAKILWAHAGFSEPPAAVERVLDAHKRVWAETSYRAGDIAPGGTLDAAWKALFVKHPDRFMIGADVSVVGRWNMYARIIAEHRRWLAQLPPDAAAAIAWKNAARHFGGAELFGE